MSDNVQKYIQRIQDEQKAAQERQSALLNAERIAGQLNNKSNKPVYGKAAEYKKQLAACKFKLVVYFNQDKTGRYFTQVEKDAKKNRQYIPSFDYVNQGGRLVVNHDIAHTQLIEYCLQNASRIQSARMILNDYINEEELTIFVFDPKNIGLSKYCYPIFKEQPQTGGVFFSHCDVAPVRVDKMRFYEK